MGGGLRVENIREGQEQRGEREEERMGHMHANSQGRIGCVRFKVVDCI